MLRLRIFLTVSIALLLGGCTYVMKADQPPLVASIRLDIHDPEAYSLRIGKDGAPVSAGPDGLFRVELPEVPGRCDTYIWYPYIPFRTYPAPELYIFRGSKPIEHMSIVRVGNLPQDERGTRSLSVK